jgi:hypothetical protein
LTIYIRPWLAVDSKAYEKTLRMLAYLLNRLATGLRMEALSKRKLLAKDNHSLLLLITIAKSRY